MSVLRRIDNITKSNQDQRQYRGIELANGLKALLVSDPTTDKAAASLDVGVGHLMDRWEMPGTAHFCEHMLFLGTEKYPIENDYFRYITSNAGFSNAFTNSNNTCYYFEIQPTSEAFVGALDRFVQFFLTPMFTPSATEREVLAVDSEHNKNLKNDLWRLLQVQRFLSKPGHDYGKFGTGDKNTLGTGAIANGLDVRQELLNFHKQWYSSNIMSLVLFGKESLDELEGYVTNLGFDKIPNKNVELKYWKEQPLGPEQMKKRVTVVPIKESRELKLYFNIPYFANSEYKTFPAHYLTHLLGHESKGSLLSELKKQGLVASLATGELVRARGVTNFCVNMRLTEEGLVRVDDILLLIFEYVAMLKQKGIQEWIFNELKQMGEINFEFRDKIRPVEFVARMPQRMHDIPLEDTLTYHNTISVYKPELIGSILNCLTPDNFLYILVDKSIAGREGNIHEPIYGTEMRIDPICSQQLEKFRNAVPNSVFYLPERNQYIPTDLKLKAEQSKSEHPTVVLKTPWIRVWHKKDDEYNLPKSIITVRIYSPAIHQSPRNSVLIQLLGMLFNDSLTEDVYIPKMAGLKYDFEKTFSAFKIEVYGYNEKQPLFLTFLLKHFVEFVPEKKSFAIQLNELQRMYKNAEHYQPTTLSSNCLNDLLWNMRWTEQQKLAEIANLTVEDVLRFRQELFAAFHIEMLAHGNVTEGETIALSSRVVEILTNVKDVKSRQLYVNEFWRNREVALPAGKDFLYRYWKNSHEVSCVEIWYQLGTITTSLHAMNNLLMHIMKEPAFDRLRTKETLGYVVWTSTHISNGVSSNRILVQGIHGPDAVRKRIMAFMKQFEEFLEKMTEEEFEKERDATVFKLLIQPKTMAGRHDRFLKQIFGKTYDFRKNENMAEYLRGVSKKDLIQFFHKYMTKERKTVTIFIHSRADCQSGKDIIPKMEEGSVDYEEISSPYDFRETLGLLAHPKPKMSLEPLGISPIEAAVVVDKAHI